MHHQRPRQLDVLDRQREGKLRPAGDERNGLGHRFETKDRRQEVRALIHVIPDVGIPF